MGVARAGVGFGGAGAASRCRGRAGGGGLRDNATRDGDDGARDMASVATRARCATIKVREFAPRELGRTRRGRARRGRATTFWISV